MKRFFALLLSLAMLFTLVACGSSSSTSTATNAATNAATDAAPNAGGEVAAPSGSDNQAVAEDNKVYIGVVTHLTGSAAFLGDYQKTITDAWGDYTNKNGGILGKEVEFVFFDCVDDIQTAINAYEMACEDERLSCIFLSTYSQNCIAVLDLTDEYKIPTLMGGSGYAINVGKEYVWMARPLDSAAGQTMVTYMGELGLSNPVVVHNTLASCLTGAENVVKALKAAGYDFDESKMMFGYENTETNFAPLVARMQETGADCLLFFGNQADGANLSKAIQDAGWDITRIGNSTISHAQTIDLAGTAINGWYCVAEASLESDKPENIAWIQVLKDYYGEDFTMTTNYYGSGYDLIKAVMELAGSTTDREAINAAMKEIDLVTANGHLAYYGDSNLACEMFICQMVDQQAKLVKAVAYR